MYAPNNVSTFTPVLENIYDTHGNLIAINDKVNGTTIEYTLDKFGNTTLQTDTQHGVAVNKSFVYDEYLNNTATSLTIDAETRNYDCTYNTVAPESILEKVTYSKNVISAEGATIKEVLAYQEITNDKLDRTKEIKLFAGADNTAKHNTRLFHYLKNGDHASNQVSSIWFGDNDKYLDNLKYKYDEKGNITEVYENSFLQVRYKYDNLSRLIREDNKPLNKTTTWEYDAGGYEDGGDVGKSGVEDGKAGGLGAGGGGAFSYWTENPGGQGGYPGFIIFY